MTLRDLALPVGYLVLLVVAIAVVVLGGMAAWGFLKGATPSRPRGVNGNGNGESDDAHTFQLRGGVHAPPGGPRSRSRR